MFYERFDELVRKNTRELDFRVKINDWKVREVPSLKIVKVKRKGFFGLSKFYMIFKYACLNSKYQIVYIDKGDLHLVGNYTDALQKNINQKNINQLFKV